MRSNMFIMSICNTVQFSKAGNWILSFSLAWLFGLQFIWSTWSIWQLEETMFICKPFFIWMSSRYLLWIREINGFGWTNFPEFQYANMNCKIISNFRCRFLASRYSLSTMTALFPIKLFLSSFLLKNLQFKSDALVALQPCRFLYLTWAFTKRKSISSSDFEVTSIAHGYPVGSNVIDKIICLMSTKQFVVISLYQTPINS